MGRNPGRGTDPAVEYGTKARHGKNIRAFYHESGQGMYISVRGKGITETVVAV